MWPQISQSQLPLRHCYITMCCVIVYNYFKSITPKSIEVEIPNGSANVAIVISETDVRDFLLSTSVEYNCPWCNICQHFTAAKHLNTPGSHSFRNSLSGTLLWTLKNLKIASRHRIASALCGLFCSILSTASDCTLFPGELLKEQSAVSGAVYTRWGKIHCPSGATELYSGI